MKALAATPASRPDAFLRPYQRAVFCDLRHLGGPKTPVRANTPLFFDLIQGLRDFSGPIRPAIAGQPAIVWIDEFAYLPRHPLASEASSP